VDDQRLFGVQSGVGSVSDCLARHQPRALVSSQVSTLQAPQSRGYTLCIRRTSDGAATLSRPGQKGLFSTAGSGGGSRSLPSPVAHAIPHVAGAQREPQISPDGRTDDVRRKPAPFE